MSAARTKIYPERQFDFLAVSFVPPVDNAALLDMPKVQKKLNSGSVITHEPTANLAGESKTKQLAWFAESFEDDAHFRSYLELLADHIGGVALDFNGLLPNGRPPEVS